MDDIMRKRSLIPENDLNVTIRAKVSLLKAYDDLVLYKFIFSDFFDKDSLIFLNDLLQIAKRK